MTDNPYRTSSLAPIPPPRVHTPFMWRFRVWCHSRRVSAEAGQTWNFMCDDKDGNSLWFKLPWSDRTIERLAVLCENTPPGEPASIGYFVNGGHREVRFPPAPMERVVFIHPSQVPTVGRIARQAWESYRRLHAVSGA